MSWPSTLIFDKFNECRVAQIGFGDHVIPIATFDNIVFLDAANLESGYKRQCDVIAV